MSNPYRLPWLDAIMVEVARRLRVDHEAKSVEVTRDGKPFLIIDEYGKEYLPGTEERLAELVDKAIRIVGEREAAEALEHIKRNGSAFRPPTNDAVFEADFADKWLTDMDDIYARERAARLALGFEEAARRYGDKYADEELDTIPLGTAEEERARCASYMKLAARWIMRAKWLRGELEDLQGRYGQLVAGEPDDDPEPNSEA